MPGADRESVTKEKSRTAHDVLDKKDHKVSRLNLDLRAGAVTQDFGYNYSDLVRERMYEELGIRRANGTLRNDQIAQIVSTPKHDADAWRALFKGEFGHSDFNAEIDGKPAFEDNRIKVLTKFIGTAAKTGFMPGELAAALSGNPPDFESIVKLARAINPKHEHAFKAEINRALARHQAIKLAEALMLYAKHDLNAGEKINVEKKLKEAKLSEENRALLERVFSNEELWKTSGLSRHQQRVHANTLKRIKEGNSFLISTKENEKLIEALTLIKNTKRKTPLTNEQQSELNQSIAALETQRGITSGQRVIIEKLQKALD